MNVKGVYRSLRVDVVLDGREGDRSGEGCVADAAFPGFQIAPFRAPAFAK
jgi:hypothetical protein